MNSGLELSPLFDAVFGESEAVLKLLIKRNLEPGKFCWIILFFGVDRGHDSLGSLAAWW